MFSKQKGKSRLVMDKMVVLSLHTDGKGNRRNEFAAWRDKLTGTSSNPVYVVMDPFEKDKVLFDTDYNVAKDDELFAAKLGKANRRFLRALKGRGLKAEVKK